MSCLPPHFSILRTTCCCIQVFILYVVYQIKYNKDTQTFQLSEWNYHNHEYVSRVQSLLCVFSNSGGSIWFLITKNDQPKLFTEILFLFVFYSPNNICLCCLITGQVNTHAIICSSALSFVSYICIGLKWIRRLRSTAMHRMACK